MSWKSKKLEVESKLLSCDKKDFFMCSTEEMKREPCIKEYRPYTLKSVI